MIILLIEDDCWHQEVIKKALQTHLADPEIHVITSEKEFRRKLPKIHETSYDLFVFDQMLPWTTVEDEDYNDADAPSEGPLRAGTRCYDLLTDREKAKSVFLTNLDRTAVPDPAHYVRKKDDPELEEFLNVVDSLLKPRDRT